jgi:hypothetical protein
MAKKKPKVKKNGRPFSITKEKEEELIRLMADGMSQAKACAYLGISEMTIIRHKERFSEFSERLEAAKLETTKLAHKSVKMGMVRDWKAGSWWLERTEPERFREQKQIDVKEMPNLVFDVFDDKDKPNGESNS